FEVESDAGFGTSALEFIPSGATAGQQRLAVEGRPEFTDPLPLGGGYLAALLGGRFVVVDVRRARERILYEDYLKMLGNGSSVSQQLLFPERLVLSGDEYALLEENAVEFASLGFDIDFAGEGTIEVKGTPADMPADAVDQMVYDLLQAFSTPVSLADQRREKIAAVMARGGAKGIPRNMSRDEAAVLLAQLAATGNFSFSPSGKAITAEITPEDIRTKLG
ncbi:DNA mismatch repair protein MutL, partial [Proteus mirabilis]|nr:DNA mismatch repair protein MutL [Proteus mirabilis]